MVFRQTFCSLYDGGSPGLYWRCRNILSGDVSDITLGMGLELVVSVYFLMAALKIGSRFSLVCPLERK